MKNKYHFRSRISERQFRDILKMFCADITALAAAGLVGVNKNTTHQLYGRLRARVAGLTVEQSRPFTGEVEIDESYFGARRVRGRRGTRSQWQDTGRRPAQKRRERLREDRA